MHLANSLNIELLHARYVMQRTLHQLQVLQEMNSHVTRRTLVSCMHPESFVSHCLREHPIHYGNISAVLVRWLQKSHEPG